MIMKSVRFGVLLTTLSSLLCMARGGGEHEHGDKAFEWAGIFETPESDYLWTAQKVNERYADATMILVALPVTTFTEETLHGLEEQGEHAMNLTCTDLQAGGHHRSSRQYLLQTDLPTECLAVSLQRGCQFRSWNCLLCGARAHGV